MTSPLLTVHELHKSFQLQRGLFASSQEKCLAVQDVSLSLYEGETLGIVGESGCGKTTLARMIAHIEKPTAGEIRYKGRNIYNFNKKQLKAYRRKAQFIFQDPYASLNPRLTAGEIIAEPFIIHRHNLAQDIDTNLESIMKMVGLSRDQQRRYPHEFSGGQRQRIGIARAIALRPEIIIADEPVSALDVSVQAQILNLLKDLQEKFNLTYIFISHDMGVIRFISDRIAVMHRGRIVEMASNQQLFENPQHPYTRTLLDAVPRLD
ncbi:MAG: ATP-binding cassette domain-containing protein [Syntrophales bacterium]|jgi:ABC-type oligopeptide transport system ATPase subunit|nr:ATP-binding cassette domain-containing protein [Syntrophales bacterium]MCK9391790.1 ATP-binding cassette domain-containing protein [Syntrophales bacterium]